MTNILTYDDIHRLAPSVFATTPYHEVSDKYRFIPTHEVVDKLTASGFVAVSAKEAYTRLESKKGFVAHTLRFRHPDFTKFTQVLEALDQGKEVPELVLRNGHDGCSSYQLDLGFFRYACSNKMIVNTSSVQTIRVRHVGSRNLIDDVLEASYTIIDEAPKIAEQVGDWKAKRIGPKAQEAFADAALELRETRLEFSPQQVLIGRREEDRADQDGTRSLWSTLNVVQENLTKGGMQTRGATGRRERLKPVKGVDADAKLNRALWLLTEKINQLAA